MRDKSSQLTDTPLKSDLLHFYDDFVEFHDYCSFMCDAFACLAMEEDCLDKSTALGASRYCHWVKRRMEALKKDLKKIHEKAYAQNQISSRAPNRNLR